MNRIIEIDFLLQKAYEVIKEWEEKTKQNEKRITKDVEDDLGILLNYLVEGNDFKSNKLRYSLLRCEDTKRYLLRENIEEKVSKNMKSFGYIFEVILGIIMIFSKKIISLVIKEEKKSSDEEGKYTTPREFLEYIMEVRKDMIKYIEALDLEKCEKERIIYIKLLAESLTGICNDLFRLLKEYERV